MHDTGVAQCGRAWQITEASLFRQKCEPAHTAHRQSSLVCTVVGLKRPTARPTCCTLTEELWKKKLTHKLAAVFLAHHCPGVPTWQPSNQAIAPGLTVHTGTSRRQVFLPPQHHSSSQHTHQATTYTCRPSQLLGQARKAVLQFSQQAISGSSSPTDIHHTVLLSTHHNQDALLWAAD